MDSKQFFLYLLVMAGTTYLVRAVPFAAVRGKIKNRFIRSFLYYIPYAVLSAMTYPAIFYSTGNSVSAIAGTAAAMVLAYFNLPLIVVAICASVCAFVAGLF